MSDGNLKFVMFKYLGKDMKNKRLFRVEKVYKY